MKSRTHLVIPDTQCKPGVPMAHLGWLGRYIKDREPDVVIMLGDWWDMPSLSSYDAGKKAFEGRRYIADIKAGNTAMDLLMAGMAGFEPELHFLIGNHEERIERAIESDAKLDGTIGYHQFNLEEHGWEVHPFLEPVELDGITYCHFFPRSASGAVSQTKRGAPNARAQLIRQGGSCTAGHQQGLDVACLPLRGRLQWGIIAGSFYQHNEGYLSPQGNDHWRGIVVKHQVRDGSYDPMFVSLDYLRRRYGKKGSR